MEQKFCMICHWYCGSSLCKKHRKYYMWDKSIDGFRLKKRKTCSKKIHIWKSETQLAKDIESFYGKSNVVRGYHPMWAISDHGVLLEYDILIKDKKILIEYNGIQHYRAVKYFHIGKKALKRRKKLDSLKRKLAEQNGYSLVVFRYDEPVFKDYVIKKIEETHY